MLLEGSTHHVDTDRPAPFAFDEVHRDAAGLGDVGHVLAEPTVAHDSHALAGHNHAADGDLEARRARADNREDVALGPK